MLAAPEMQVVARRRPLRPVVGMAATLALAALTMTNSYSGSPFQYVRVFVAYLLFRIHCFDFAGRPSQRGSRQIKLEQRGDLIVAGTRQCILRGDDFHVGGDAGGESALSLSHFILGQFIAQVGDVHGISRGVEL